MLKRIRYKIISGAAAAVAAGSAVLFAYFYAALPLNIYAGAGEELCGAGFAPASLKTTDNGAEYFFCGIPIKRAVVTEKERRYVIPSGEPFGVKVMSDGVIVTETAEGSPARKCGLKTGDVITSVNGTEVSTNEELAEAIKRSGEKADIVYRRGGSVVSASVGTVISDGERKIGAWVRDSAAGIGTLTFIDPETGEFGGLGHAVSDVTTGEPVPLGSGQITEAEVYDVVKGEKGTAGELCGRIISENETGEVLENTSTGIFGKYKGDFNGETVPVAFTQEVKTGAATIITALDDSEPREYSIEIERINLADLHGAKGMLIRITDPELLEKTGGIVRGMSGSPIIQNGRLAGAVTHVLLSDPSRGYAVFAESMPLVY